MSKSIIVILIGIIIFLIGLVISITESFSTEIYWIGVILILTGLIVIGVSVLGKIKNWF